MDFFKRNGTRLKICGVQTFADAQRLTEMGVHALGFNFWPLSKRFLHPENQWMKELSGKILRVGVFVNEESGLARRLYEDGMIDVIQLHGDESYEQVQALRNQNIPIIKAVGVKTAKDMEDAGKYEADAILLDAHAPQVFGGTGEVFDWSLGRLFKNSYPQIPLILAGGIRPENAAQAISALAPCMLDVASGGEISPGVKDFQKVADLLLACEASQ